MEGVVRLLLRRLTLVAGAAVVLLVLLTAVTPQGRAAVRTALFIPQVLPTIPIKPQEWVARDPEWRAVRFPTARASRT